MSMRGYAYRSQQQVPQRSFGVSLVAVAGMVLVLALIGLEIALILMRTQRGVPLLLQVNDLMVAIGVGFLLIWTAWGVWERQAGAWQFHIFVGPLLLIGLGAVVLLTPEIAPIVAHHLKESEMPMAMVTLRAIAVIAFACELGTVIVLAGEQKEFGIGRQKELWEQVLR